MNWVSDICGGRSLEDYYEAGVSGYTTASRKMNTKAVALMQGKYNGSWARVVRRKNQGDG